MSTKRTNDTPASTGQPSTDPTPPANPGPGASTAASAAEEPSVYTLLARIMSRSSNKEKKFLEEFLKDCATSHLDVQVDALRHVETAFGLNLFAEDIERYVKEINALSQIMILDQTWFADFLRLVFGLRMGGRAITPDLLMGLLAAEIYEQDQRLSAAREILKENPELLADEIQEAVRRGGVTERREAL